MTPPTQLTDDVISIWNAHIRALPAAVASGDVGWVEVLKNLPPVKGNPGELREWVQLQARCLGRKALTPPTDEIWAPAYPLLARDPSIEWPWSNHAKAFQQVIRGTHEDQLHHSAQLVAALDRHLDVVGGDPTQTPEWTLLMTLFWVRPRGIWVHAATAIARRMVGPDRDATGVRAEREAWLHGIKTGAPSIGPSGIKRRHVLTAATAGAALAGGAFGPYTLADLLDHDPKGKKDLHDADTLCAMATGLRLIGRASEAASLLVRTARSPRGQTYQMWDEARRWIDAFTDQHPDATAVFPLLLEAVDDSPAAQGPTRDVSQAAPVWVRPAIAKAANTYVGEGTGSPGNVAGAVLDGITTAAWLRATGREAHLPALQRGRLRLAPHLADITAFPAQAWRDRVRTLLYDLEPSTFLATPRSVVAASFAELLSLAGEPEAATLRWADVCGEHHRHEELDAEATVSAVARLDLAARAQPLGLLFREVLHQIRFDPSPASNDDKAGPPANTGLAKATAGRWRIVGAKKDPGSSPWAWDVNTTMSGGVAWEVARRAIVGNYAPQTCGPITLALVLRDAPPWPLPHNGDAPSKGSAGLWEDVGNWMPDMAESRGMLSAAGALKDRAAATTDDDRRAAEARLVTALPAWSGWLEALEEALQTTVRFAANAPQEHETPRRAWGWWKHHGLPALEDLQRQVEALEADARIAPPPEPLRAAIALAQQEEPNDGTTHFSETDVDAWTAALQDAYDLSRRLPAKHRERVAAGASKTLAWAAAARARSHRRHEAQTAIRQARERHADQEALTVALADLHLLDDAEIRSLGNYFLRHLNFDAADALRTQARQAGVTTDIPTSVAYYAPLLIAILGAPLSAIQTNYIWEPVLGAYEGGESLFRYGLMVALLYGATALALRSEARRRRAGRAPAWPSLLRRGAPLIGFTFAINALVLFLSGTHHEHPLATVALWSGLSMFMGTFFGLVAQSEKSEDDG